jgi:hypothetical protein
LKGVKMTGNESTDRAPQMLSFSNGIAIECSRIVCIESNQQQIPFPGSVGELTHLLDGRPSNLLVRLHDGSTVEINAGTVRLQIQLTGT